MKEHLGHLDNDASERVHGHTPDGDGDALRLAVKLGVIVGTYAHYSTVDFLTPHERIETVTVWHSETGGDACAATRLAITRADAEIARATGQTS